MNVSFIITVGQKKTKKLNITLKNKLFHKNKNLYWTTNPDLDLKQLFMQVRTLKYL